MTKFLRVIIRFLFTTPLGHLVLQPKRALPKTELGILKRRRVLVVLDEDNLRISARKHMQGRVNFGSLLQRVRRLSKSVEPLAVTTTRPGDRRRETYFCRQGWETVVLEKEIVASVAGPMVKCNADLDIAFECGQRLARRRFDVLLLGSGDGDLAVAIARGVKRLKPAMKIITLTVNGSSSHRLKDVNLFDHNIALETDLIERQATGARSRHQGNGGSRRKAG